MRKRDFLIYCITFLFLILGSLYANSKDTNVNKAAVINSKIQQIRKNSLSKKTQEQIDNMAAIYGIKNLNNNKDGQFSQSQGSESFDAENSGEDGTSQETDFESENANDGSENNTNEDIATEEENSLLDKALEKMGINMSAEEKDSLKSKLKTAGLTVAGILGAAGVAGIGYYIYNNSDTFKETMSSFGETIKEQASKANASVKDFFTNFGVSIVSVGLLFTLPIFI